MARQKRGRLRRFECRARVRARALLAAVASLWRAFRCRRRPVPVEVLVAEAGRRLALRRVLLAGLRQLDRALGEKAPARLAVVVQHSIHADGELAGCYQVWQTADGSRAALIRLALQVQGRTMSTDELLSVLGEQYLGLAVQLFERPTVLVPLTAASPDGGRASRPAWLRPDPLTPDLAHPRIGAPERAA